MIESAQSDIQKIALDLLSEGKVDLFIGYEKASIPLKSRPYFIYPDGTASGETENAGSLDGGPSDADKKAALEKMTSNLVWDSFCANNIAAFLQKHFENVPNRRKPRENGYPTIGVVVKGCDLRSVVALIKERQVVRENLVLVGVPCQGMIDKRKVEAKLGGMEVKEYHETSDDVLHVTTLDGKKHSFPKADVMQDACIECRFPMPENTDFMIAGEAKEPGDGGYARIAEFEAKPREERWAYFQEELSKCIRCNACRQACPTCWCKECFADHTDLKWIGVGNDISDAMIFQLVRVYHQAGRCVECDACYNACPMGIDLRTYTKKMVKDVEELFGYLPDYNTESVPPLSTFSEQDTDFFITDPDKK